MNKFIFLDRDGVINEDPGYVYRIEDFAFIPGAVEGLRLLKKAGFMFMFITNQSGIGRGYYGFKDFKRFNNHVVEALEKKGIEIQKTHVCPHQPDEECDCRKPSPRSIIDAKKEFNIDLKKSYMIGDHPTDIELGKNAEVKTVYLLTGHGIKHQADLKDKPDHTADNLLKAAEWIIEDEKQD